MRAIAIVCVITSFSFILVSAPAEAKGEDWLKAFGAILVASESRRPAPQPEPILSLPRQPGAVLVTQVSGPSSTAWVAGDVLSAAGWSVVYDQDRRAAEEERRRYGGTLCLDPVSYFLSVRTEFRNGREYDRSDRGRYGSSANGGRERLCTVYLRVASVGANGRTFLSSGTGSSWCRYERYEWRSYRWGASRRDYTPTDDDKALLAAMVAASNDLVRQVSASPVGTSGQFCSQCGKSTPQGANFCPRCGTRLSAPQVGGAEGG